jgi:molybdopterin molybdotransferase
MKTVQEALQGILSHFDCLPAESISLEEGLNRVLAGDAVAANDLPPFANSSMDGYALRATDLTTIPVTLRVIGDIPAGSNPTFTVEAGQAARIMTGAPMPPGADSVVPVEDTDDGSGALSQIEIRRQVSSGAYVRPQGEDVQTGEKVLSAGHRLRPQDLGLLAGLGVPKIDVVTRPRVAIISTGDELLTPDQAITPGKIRDTNSYSLRGMVQALGAEPLPLGIARDTEDAVREKFNQAAEAGADVILSSAGVSVGARDVVKTVLDELGELDFWRVNMRPGKPLAFGSINGVPFFGLPGNPVSSLISFEVFVRPSILKMLGLPVIAPEVQAVVAENMSSDGRESFIRVTLTREDGQLVARETGTQSSGALSSLVKADGLLIIPAGVTQVRAGDALKVRPFGGQPIWM